jgi:hypothetical protein
VGPTSSGSDGSRGSDDGGAVDIDCTASHAAARGGSGSAVNGAPGGKSGPGPVDVARMLHHSNAISLAVSQVRAPALAQGGRRALNDLQLGGEPKHRRTPRVQP